MASLSGYNKNAQIDTQSLIIKKQNSKEGLDILPLMDQFIIYEDLFQTAVSARLIFRDQVNLVGSMPIVGGELVTIVYKTPIYADVVTLDFIVYQIAERGITNSNENIQINQLMLCTPEVWFAANNNAESAYSGTYSDIVEKILKETGTKKKFIKEESVGIVQYVSPQINAFKSIKFCASRANSKTQSPMFFWESPSGYHMKSLKEIYRAPQYKFIYIEDRGVSGVDKDGDKVFNTVFSFDYPASNNRLAQYSANAFGADNISVDFTNKRITKTLNSYEDVFNKADIKLNKFPLNDDAKSIRNASGYIPYRSDLSHLNEYNRLCTTMLMDNVSLIVNIPGDSKLEVGAIVWLNIPAKVGLEIGSEAHTSGKWLVRSIKHLIQKTTYSMICELTKDSFDSDVNTGR
jgi:hypothetical protein